MKTSEHALVLITCADAGEAETIARSLVGSGLAAGVQMIPIRSVYTWQEEVVDDEEILLLAKTRVERFDDIARIVEGMHSYEVPPVVMIPIGAANPPYLEWIDGATGD